MTQLLNFSPFFNPKHLFFTFEKSLVQTTSRNFDLKCHSIKILMSFMGGDNNHVYKVVQK